MKQPQIPLALSEALAQNTRAQDWFFGLDDKKQQSIAAQAAQLDNADAIRTVLDKHLKETASQA